MNVREEDKQKNACPSRGLGLAAAAIGVGVGAALYYFFSKRPEHPDGEGSTTGWNTEQPHALLDLHDDSDSYTTVSEHSTTDTSIHESSDSEMESNSEYSDESSNSEMFDDVMQFDSTEFVDSSGSDIGTEWDVTDSSTDLPEDNRSPMLSFFSRFRSPTPRRQRNVEQERATVIRDQAFRERSWSLEECSICFDVILKDQKVSTLPCTHHFHAECLAPWLQEQQTCPNCRKAAE